MPLECTLKFDAVSQDRFKKLDYEVMRHAFDVQNQMGNLFCEHVYQVELKERLEASGHTVAIEIPVMASYQNFRKSYYLDLVVDQAGIYELKTVNNLTEKHRAQAIHYLHLAKMRHGKLVNFRSQSVESEFVSTSMSHEDRFHVEVNADEWDGSIQLGKKVMQTFLELIQHWGLFLQTELYSEALMNLTSNVPPDERKVRMQLKQGFDVYQPCNLISEDTAIQITTLKRGLNGFESNLRKWLSHTPLMHCLWINMNNHAVSFKTLSHHSAQNHSACILN